MAPHGEAIVSSYSRSKTMTSKPPRLSTDSLHRTISDISFELSKELDNIENLKQLPPISEVEDAKCECCGMCEEFTLEYISKVRAKYSGKWICGLCSEAVKEEVEKNGGKIEDALSSHISACVRFNKFGRAYPVLFQAEAMREILKKSKSLDERVRDKSMPKKGGIARSSSCIPAITKDMNDLTLSNRAS
ncbi:Protein of unknown function DUF1677, plant [Dillenia turbinata]|uniref:Uncharacterized protein n=1 Tax=Dillenia turbinata TaxID=194707 RepID=A0AAN8YWA0_9MAGN